MLIGSILVLGRSLAFAGEEGTVSGTVDILLDAAHAIDKKALEKAGKVLGEHYDAIGEETKSAIAKLVAMRNTSLKIGKSIRNVFTGNYFIALYDARINQGKGAVGLLWDDARLSTYVVFTGEDLTDVQDALRRGPGSLKMVLRDYYLTRHIDIDPSLSIVNDLAAISLDAAMGGPVNADIAHFDLVSSGDKEKAADYIGHIYEKAVKIQNLKENVRLGSALISIYDASIDNLSTGALFFFYRQTDEGTFLPLRDPAATWHSAWLEHILDADAETKRLLLTDMFRDICVDPNFPHPVEKKRRPYAQSEDNLLSPWAGRGRVLISDSILPGSTPGKTGEQASAQRVRAVAARYPIRPRPTAEPHAVSADSRLEEERGRA